jgi:uncharacterized protein
MPRTVPELTPENISFWTGGANEELMITHCEACDIAIHPPQIICPACASSTTPRPAQGTGTVLARTINRQPWSPDISVPYLLAVVELTCEPTVRITARIVNAAPESVKIGDRVRVLFDREGDIWYPMFEPLMD